MRACWLKWVGRDWSISADYIWLNYSDANNDDVLGYEIYDENVELSVSSLTAQIVDKTE